MESSNHAQSQSSTSKGLINQSNSFKLNKKNSLKSSQTDTLNLQSQINSKKIYTMTSFNETLFEPNSSQQTTLGSSPQSDNFQKFSKNLTPKKSICNDGIISNINRDKNHALSLIDNDNETTKRGSNGFEIL
jgi:hypothetical protein